MLGTRSRAVMGAFVNPRWLTGLMRTITGLVTVLDVALVVALVR